MASNQRSHCAQAGCRAHLESLEPRLLLSTNSGGDPGVISVSPDWFQEVVPTVCVEPSVISSELVAVAGQQVVASSRWIVRLDASALKTATSPSQAQALFANSLNGLRVIRGLGLAGQLLLEASTDDTEAVSAELAARSGLAYFQQDLSLSIARLPNDPSFSRLWGLNNSGQTGGLVDADIDAPEAWNLVTGSSNVVVAVIDTGAQYNHPDLAANMWVNSGEIAGNMLDDDHNGFVDDIYGYDFQANHGDITDDHGHGTHVSGTIAAVGNNAKGVTGVAWQAKIMSLDMFNSSGSGRDSDAIRAMNYATMMKTQYGVNIVLTNNSWSGDGYDQGLLDAIEAAGQAGILCIAAAGNSSTNNDSPVGGNYPASYESDIIISVAASTSTDTLASFSCFGATSVDLAAPGDHIYSLTKGSSYAEMSGTSMAAPHVSGVAALAKAAAPYASLYAIRKAILEGVDPVESLTGLVATGGRLNALRTIERIRMAVSTSSVKPGQVLSNLAQDFTISFTNAINAASLSASAFRVNGIAADSFTIIDDHTVSFHFSASPMVGEGTQVMAMAAGAVLRSGDLVPLTAWTESFYYDQTPLALVSSTPSHGDTVSQGPTQIVLNFNEPIDPASVDADDLILFDLGCTVTSAVAVDADTAVYTVSGTWRDEVPLGFSLRSNSLRDAHGTPSGVASDVTFTVDDPAIHRYVSTDVGQTLTTLGQLTSTLTIVDNYHLGDLDVEILLYVHAGDGITISLTAPDGTTTQLFHGYGRNFLATVIDDEAAQAFTRTGEAFIGRFRPLESLALQDGQTVAGDWTLTVENWEVWAGSATTLAGWSLYATEDPYATPRILSVVIAGLYPDTQSTYYRIDHIPVVFSETMDPATVNAVANWSLVCAGGDSVFDTADDVTYSLSVSPAYSGPGRVANLAIGEGILPAGLYRLEAFSGGLANPLGIVLDGDSDGLPGADFAFSFSVLPTLPLPYLQGFEDDSLESLTDAWSLKSGTGGQIATTSQYEPRYGSQHLLLSSQALSGSVQTATLHVCLSGRTGVVLDFWSKRIGNVFGSDSANLVEMSDNGQQWRPIRYLWGSDITSDYMHYAVDLDMEMMLEGWSYSDDFQIRFVQQNPLGGGFTIDGLRLRDNATPNWAPWFSGTGIDTMYAYQGMPTTIRYEDIPASVVDNDEISFRVESVLVGTLTKNGQPVVPGQTLLSAGESFIWDPGDAPVGLVEAFTVRAYDGDLDSLPAVVRFELMPRQAYIDYACLFYNNSYFDGFNAGANASDDNAIASDKYPVWVNQWERGTFYNYSSYSRGLNGLMVDFIGQLNAPTAADFIFKVGNDPDISNWSDAPAPESITLRPGAGASGGDRVSFVWADGAIRNSWLLVLIPPSDNIPLAQTEGFFFGNAVGDSCNVWENAWVNSFDEIGARQNPRTPTNRATIDNPYDYNRDSLVNSADQLIARYNKTTPTTALKVMELPWIELATPAQPPQTEVSPVEDSPADQPQSDSAQQSRNDSAELPQSDATTPQAPSAPIVPAPVEQPGTTEASPAAAAAPEPQVELPPAPPAPCEPVTTPPAPANENAEAAAEGVETVEVTPSAPILPLETPATQSAALPAEAYTVVVTPDGLGLCQTLTLGDPPAGDPQLPQQEQIVLAPGSFGLEPVPPLAVDVPVLNMTAASLPLDEATDDDSAPWMELDQEWRLDVLAQLRPLAVFA